MYEFVILSLGLISLFVLTSLGTTEAMTSAGISSIMYCQKKSIITQAYVAIIMASTIFMYALIIAMTIIFGVSSNSKNLVTAKALDYFQACMLYGLCAYFGGKAMAQTCKYGFDALYKVPEFFLNFIMMMSGIEVVLIFGFIFALLLTRQT
ncbi:hypothetical protein EDEG_03339 [Edhazardia aedis USNM 41457]|uniref:V-ATPase proteolipid subunit C-like domain-containing protein n=1 Tax=Edhazardia aedis (strain USNM 41457) TaxID=1003232 RepID=J9D324_EDHAE|nr:hypothetical protein EDEG_03339 [Edhazardia aedis USNM 41457]|eukprot:EJW02221.1 hypothetical protein EDEG_03339 [Edhazardia aedis USNM 41457]